MRLTITIDCDNAAFDADIAATHEVGKILADATDAIELSGIYPGVTIPLRDSHGNTVGQAKITRGKR